MKKQWGFSDASKKNWRVVPRYTNQKKNKIKLRMQLQFKFNQNTSSFSRGGPTWHVRDGCAQHGVTRFTTSAAAAWDDAPLPHSGLLTPFHVKLILIFYPHLPEYIPTPNSLRDLVKQWLSPGLVEFSAQVGYQLLRVQILDYGLLTQFQIKYIGLGSS